MCFEYGRGITKQILNSIEKQQCAEEIPEDFGITSPGPCLLPKEHEGDHLSFTGYGDGTFWQVNPEEESLKHTFVSEEKTLLKLKEAWGEKIPEGVLNLFKEEEDEEDEDA